jgi:hypothetical protein
MEVLQLEGHRLLKLVISLLAFALVWATEIVGLILIVRDKTKASEPAATLHDDRAGDSLTHCLLENASVHTCPGGCMCAPSGSPDVDPG